MVFMGRLRMAEAATTPGQDRGPELRLVDIPLRQACELVRIDLPHEELEPLFERGMLPGCELCPVRRSPSGDPIVTVDGTLLALRREMATCLCVRLRGGSAGEPVAAGSMPAAD
jgi:Fe2+ transport system protein FeoA